MSNLNDFRAACQFKDCSAAIDMINYNANSRDNYANTPLLLATTYDCFIEVIQILLKNGANVQVAQGRRSGVTPLHNAARHSSTDVIELLLKRGANITSVTSDGSTTLHYEAGSSKSTEVIGLLLDRGADINAVNRGRQSPLHWAVRNENGKEILKLFKARGANITAANDGGTPLLVLSYPLCSCMIFY